MPKVIENFIGVLKDPMNLEEIAKKFNTTIEALQAEMVMGLREEKEHTPDEATAGVIVLHHLSKNPKYYSEGEFRNAGSWPKSYKARHLEPGLVFYSDIGEVNPATGKPKGMMLLLKKEAIDKMRPTFKGKPVVNMFHKDVDPEDFKDGKADGIITGASYNAEDGWDWVEFLVWDEKTKENCDKKFQLSCAYVPTDIKIEPGMYHNIPYDGEVINGTYTHMAIVPNPRYEGSMIICNSIGGSMKKIVMKFLNALGVAQSVELDSKTEVDMDGKKVPLDELVNAFKAEQAEKERVALENSAKEMKDDTLINVDGKEVSVKDLKASFVAYSARLNADEEAAEKAKKEKEEAEKKNSEDEADKKKKADEEEKRNADEKMAKEEADKKAETEKRNAAEKEFLDLKNAAEKGDKKVDLPAYESSDDKLARGKNMFGKTADIK